MCKIDSEPEINLSYESITSEASLTRLANLGSTDLDFWKELYCNKPSSITTGTTEEPRSESDESDSNSVEEFEDDTSVPTEVMFQTLYADGKRKDSEGAECTIAGDGTILASGKAETLDFDIGEFFEEKDDHAGDASYQGSEKKVKNNETSLAETRAQSKRVRNAPKRFLDKDWMRH